MKKTVSFLKLLRPGLLSTKKILTDDLKILLGVTPYVLLVLQL